MTSSLPFRWQGGGPIHLSLASAVLLFANGRWAVWPAAWVGLALMVSYYRRAEGRWRPWLLGGSALWLVGAVSWFGLIPFPPPVFLRVITEWSVLGLVPFALDRVTHRRSARALQTLVFPTSLVSLQLADALWSGGGTWGHLAYTQSGLMPLAQLAAVTGLSGVAFVVAWFASWANQLWEQWEARGRVGRATFVYPVALLLVLAGGQLRLAAASETGATVRVASVTPPSLLDHLDRDALAALQRYAMREELDAARLSDVRERLEATYPELLRSTRQAARQGAEIVFWPEASLIAFGTEREAELLDVARSLAREEQIYLGASIAVLGGRERLNENKVVLLNPEGRALGSYRKARLVPHVEEPHTLPGDGRIGTQPTPWGAVATVICYDLDEPRYLAQLGERDVALLFAPSGDWPAIARLHAAMARFRIIETGIPLVRPANHGVSEVVDAHGRVLARMDHASGERVLVAKVAAGRVVTLYARWGDAFGWTCVVALPLVLIAVGVRPGAALGGPKAPALGAGRDGRAEGAARPFLARHVGPFHPAGDGLGGGVVGRLAHRDDL
jgi:apolipoprotein N-acyltransferase